MHSFLLNSFKHSKKSKILFKIQLGVLTGTWPPLATQNHPLKRLCYVFFVNFRFTNKTKTNIARSAEARCITNSKRPNKIHLFQMFLVQDVPVCLFPPLLTPSLSVWFTNKIWKTGGHQEWCVWWVCSAVPNRNENQGAVWHCIKV